MSTLLSIHQSILDVSHSLLDPETIRKISLLKLEQLEG